MLRSFFEIIYIYFNIYLEKKNVTFFKKNWTFFSILCKRTLRSRFLFKRTLRSFYVLFCKIFNVSMTYETKKNVKKNIPFFLKERKRTERTERSFEKNVKERKEWNFLLKRQKERNVLLKRTDAQPWFFHSMQEIAAADWLWYFKKTVDAWFIIGKQEAFFQRGLWGDFLELYGSKRAEDLPPPPKNR